MSKTPLTLLRTLAVAFLVNFTLQLGSVRVSVPRPASRRAAVRARSVAGAEVPSRGGSKTRGGRILRNLLISDRSFEMVAAAPAASPVSSFAPSPLLGHESPPDHPPA